MPDNGRFSEEEIEKRLRDLGAKIDYPPTPDLASAVHRKLDAEEQPRRALRWPSFSTLRWMVVAAALVLISVVALSPTLRTTVSDLFVLRAGLEAGGSAAKPESGGSEDRYKQEAGAPAQPAEAPAASEGNAATACPTPSIEAVPARTAAGAKFRLRGHDFSSGCAEVTPARGVTIFFRQAGETRKLMTLDADRALTFDTTLRVPKHAEPGRATVLANTPSGERAEARFVVLR